MAGSCQRNSLIQQVENCLSSNDPGEIKEQIELNLEHRFPNAWSIPTLNHQKKSHQAIGNRRETDRLWLVVLSSSWLERYLDVDTRLPYYPEISFLTPCLSRLHPRLQTVTEEGISREGHFTGTNGLLHTVRFSKWPPRTRMCLAPSPTSAASQALKKYFCLCCCYACGHGLMSTFLE